MRIMSVLRLEKLSIITFLLLMILISCNENIPKHNLEELDIVQSVFLTEPEIVVEDLFSTPSDIISSDSLVICITSNLGYKIFNSVICR